MKRFFSLSLGLILSVALFSPAASVAAPALLKGDAYIGFVFKGKRHLFPPRSSSVKPAELGKPDRRVKNEYECGSAFDEGDVVSYYYGNSHFEVQKNEAVLRELDLREKGNRLLLKFTELEGGLTVDEVRKRMRAKVDVHQEDGQMSLVYHFDGFYDALHLDFEKGRLSKAAYWIGC